MSENKIERIFVDTPDRTFTTRLEFIRSIFANKYDNDEILASCIQHKLKVSYEQYTDDLRRSTLALLSRDPLQVLKKIK